MYIKLFFLLNIFLFLPTVADGLRLLQKQEIDKKAVMIEKKMRRDKYVLVGLTTLGHIYNIYVFLSFVAPLFSNNDPVLQVHQLCEICKELGNTPVKEVSFLTALRSGLVNLGYNTKSLFTTSQGWRAIGQFTLYYAGLLSASFVASRVTDNLIHPDTLRWYIAAHVSYESTIQLIKDTIFIMQNQSLAQEQIDYNNNILKDSLRRLARYAESICGYVIYKLHSLDIEEQVVAKKAMEHFFNYHNSWLIDIFAQCELTNPNYNYINELIISYETEITSQLRHFYVIEGETKIDRRAIVEMM